MQIQWEYTGIFVDTKLIPRFARDICIHNIEITFTPLVDTTRTDVNMVKFKEGPFERTLTLTEVTSTWGSRRKVGILRRKASGKVYESPRIVLDSQLKDLIGRRFDTYLGQATLTLKIQDLTSKKHGDCLILFFADEKP